MRHVLSSRNVAAACCSLAMANPVFAGTAFGIYDARTLGMGGVSVASASNDNAQYYNAALLAFNDEIEERTQDGRLWFPVIVPQISVSAVDLEEISGNDLPESITNSINNFNAAPDATSAQAVLDATANLDASLAALDGEDMFADMYFGMGLSEPGRWQGAGFFFGVRLLAGGQTTITETDRAVLAAYQEGLSFIASNGAAGVARPDLFDANGALINPNSNFDSSASAAGAAITEVGVSMSRHIQLFGYPLAAGISFKVLDVDTFEDDDRVVDGRVDVERNSESDADINLDVGLVREISDQWRVGLAIKDIIPRNYRTSLGTIIRLRPRSKIGVAYRQDGLQIALDVDLTETQPLGGEQPVREVAIGAEWQLHPHLTLRTGYRKDIESIRDGVASVGVGTQWKRLVVDPAYAGGRRLTGRRTAIRYRVLGFSLPR